MIRLLFLCFIFTSLFLSGLIIYLKVKKIITENIKLKKDLKEKNESTIKNLDVETNDKKLLKKIFNKKIKYISFVKKIKRYDFILNKNEEILNLKNEHYDIIKISLNKILMNKESYYNVEIKAWKHLSSYEMSEAPTKEDLNILIKKIDFEKQFKLKINEYLLSEKNRNTNKIKIKNS